MSELSEEYERIIKELDEIAENKKFLERIQSGIFNQWAQEEIQQDNREVATPLIRVTVKSEKDHTGNPQIYENWGFYRVEDCLVRVTFNNDFKDNNKPLYIENFFGNYDTCEPYFVSHTVEDFVKGETDSRGFRDGVLYSYLKHIMGKSDLSDYSSNPYIEIVVYDDTIKKWFPETPHENFYPEVLCQEEPHPELCNEEDRKDEYKYFTIRWEN